MVRKAPAQASAEESPPRSSREEAGVDEETVDVPGRLATLPLFGGHDEGRAGSLWRRVASCAGWPSTRWCSGWAEPRRVLHVALEGRSSSSRVRRPGRRGHPSADRPWPQLRRGDDVQRAPVLLQCAGAGADAAADRAKANACWRASHATAASRCACWPVCRRGCGPAAGCGRLCAAQRAAARDRLPAARPRWRGAPDPITVPLPVSKATIASRLNLTPGVFLARAANSGGRADQVAATGLCIRDAGLLSRAAGAVGAEARAAARHRRRTLIKGSASADRLLPVAQVVACSPRGEQPARADERPTAPPTLPAADQRPSVQGVKTQSADAAQTPPRPRAGGGRWLRGRLVTAR